MEVKEATLLAGRTPAGLWSRFMSDNREPRANLKAARKRKRTMEPVIDLTSDN